MNRDLNLSIPSSLYSSLELQAKEQGVSLEALCISYLGGLRDRIELIDPQFYHSLNHGLMRDEIRKVIQSNLPKEEVKTRVNKLELEISRRYIR